MYDNIKIVTTYCLTLIKLNVIRKNGEDNVVYMILKLEIILEIFGIGLEKG